MFYCNFTELFLLTVYLQEVIKSVTFASKFCKFTKIVILTTKPRS